MIELLGCNDNLVIERNVTCTTVELRKLQRQLELSLKINIDEQANSDDINPSSVGALKMIYTNAPLSLKIDDSIPGAGNGDDVSINWNVADTGETNVAPDPVKFNVTW